ncbi:prolyl oligopeptidase family serine peptidase [Jejuia spongiicola]|uniref:prolyl oligopeptidase n=1 Tax=Jejuia spongiicola TaxID=2942207 RepID=A0ABT0QHH6_9FLAO|nr:prolyl oligopeptidase family serine peptidase [Jejuia spongiicola]MCL6296431.1 prolyl oligopeptidase family serine peptidase [Jejuia spongiicola]
MSFKTGFILILIANHYLSFGQKTYNYPNAIKESTEDVYFDSSIGDPYQWMENSNSPKLLDWLEIQSKLTKKIKNKHLSTLALRNQIGTMYNYVEREQLEGYIEKEKVDKSKYEFKYKTRSSNRFPDLLYRVRGEGNYKMLVDVKKLRKDKNDHISIEGRYINEDDDLIAIKISHNGSDWHELYFFNLKNGQKIHNSLKYLRAGSSVIWKKRSIYYDRYDEPKQGRELLDKAKGQKLYYHKIESPQSEDTLLYINSDNTGVNSFRFVKNNELLFLYNSFKRGKNTYMALSIGDVNSGYLELKPFLIYPSQDNIRVKINEVFGDKVVLKTNWGASNGRVLIVDLNKPNQPKELVPEYDIILKEVNRLGKDKIACVYRDNNRSLILIYSLNGELLKKIDFPEGKKVNYFYEENENVKYTDFSVSSFFHPDLWYQLSLDDLTFKPSAVISVPYDAESLETRYVKYMSKDSIEIPMYITCLKNTKLDGNNPTLLYGYGGYGHTVEPSFNESLTLWLLHGGVLAVPNVRGGGAEGSNWSEEGRRLKKQNAIDDFIGAAEYLINENYTNNEKLGSNGKSHGGLLVSAAAIQRPDLFKAVVAEAGPYDMLRLGKYTVGSVATNINEFGDISDLTDFKNLRSYSPLHNIERGVSYPNTLLITGDQDDRVPPFHTYKFLATLQEKANPKSLYLMYLIPGAGHGGALTSNDWVDKTLYKYAFLYEQLF